MSPLHTSHPKLAVNRLWWQGAIWLDQYTPTVPISPPGCSRLWRLYTVMPWGLKLSDYDIRPTAYGGLTVSVDEEGYLSAMGKRGRLDPRSGNLVFDGIPGEFVRLE